jgi:hypothetical protein
MLRQRSVNGAASKWQFLAYTVRRRRGATLMRVVWTALLALTVLAPPAFAADASRQAQQPFVYGSCRAARIFYFRP